MIWIYKLLDQIRIILTWTTAGAVIIAGAGVIAVILFWTWAADQLGRIDD